MILHILYVILSSCGLTIIAQAIQWYILDTPERFTCPEQTPYILYNTILYHSLKM